MVLAAGALVAALLLGIGGVFKLVRPQPSAAALVRLLPARLVRTAVGRAVLRGHGPAAAARLLGTAELTVAAGAFLLDGSLLPAAVAVAYAAFALVTWRQLRTGDPAGCGCVGGTVAPPTSAHLGLDLALAVSAAAVVLDPGRTRLAAVVAPGAEYGPALLVVSLVLGGLSWAVLAVAPQARADAVELARPRTHGSAAAA